MKIALGGFEKGNLWTGLYPDNDDDNMIMMMMLMMMMMMMIIMMMLMMMMARWDTGNLCSVLSSTRETKKAMRCEDNSWALEENVA